MQQSTGFERFPSILDGSPSPDEVAAPVELVQGGGQLQKFHLPTIKDLTRAARHVLGQRKAIGFDGLSPAGLRNPENWSRVAGLCRTAHDLLSKGKYEFLDARKGFLPRPGKLPRVHAISSLEDAIVLTAITHQLRPIYKDLPSYLVARPGVSAHDSVRRVADQLKQGPATILRFDLEKAFARAPWRHALALLRRHGVGEELIDLLASFYKVQERRFSGLVEGAPTSPLCLGLLTGHEVGPFIAEYCEFLQLYVDDGILFLRDPKTAETVRSILVARLEAVGLSLNESKTGLYSWDPSDPCPNGLHWLGFNFRDDSPVPCAEARNSLVQGVKALNTSLCSRSSPRIGRLIEGWLAYFGIGGDLTAFGDLDKRIAEECGNAGQLPKLVKLAEMRTTQQAGSPARADPRRLGRRSSPVSSSTWVTYLFLGSGSLGVVSSSEPRAGLSGEGNGNPRPEERKQLRPFLRPLDLADFEPQRILTSPDLALPAGLLVRYANISGENFIDLGLTLELVKRKLTPTDWVVRCARVGIPVKKADQLIRGAVAIDHRLPLDEPVPSSAALWKVGLVASPHPWKERVFDELIAEWRNRSISSEAICSTIEANLLHAQRKVRGAAWSLGAGPPARIVPSSSSPVEHGPNC